MSQNQHEVTQVLIDAGKGNDEAARQLWSLVYDELRRIAHLQMIGERRGHTLSTTALVHEAYVKLVDQTRIAWQDRAHFFGIAARAMRNILVDYARRRRAQKRGGGQHKVSLDDVSIPVEEHLDDLITLDDALTQLAQLNERLSKVVECRYFGGLTEAETAEILGVSLKTVQRDWAKAKGWLYMTMHGDGE